MVYLGIYTTEIVNTILIIYKNTQSVVRSHNGNTPFFDITTGVHQGDTLTPFLFIKCLDYIMNK